MNYRLLQGDVIEKLRELPDESIHVVVTSPPYWGLRDYSVEGQIGLEKTPGEYLSKMVAVFREIRRVLRKDGTCWLNMGDGYYTKPNGPSMKKSGLQGSLAPHAQTRLAHGRRATIPLAIGMKHKDVIGMPWMLAFALRADGWWLRQDLIWNKPNPMPESVNDRCTKAHEYIFLLTKRASYFYDKVAILEPTTGSAHRRGNGVNPKATKAGINSRMGVSRDPRHEKYPKSKQNESFSGAVNEIVNERNKRSVWTIPTQPCQDAHFATFPEDLVRPCILAGTSQHGCCDRCGAPWRRLLSKPSGGMIGKGYHDHSEDLTEGAKSNHGAKVFATYIGPQTIGWKPTCKCEGAGVATSTILDPFNGRGTTGLVALANRCNYIGIDLNVDNIAMSELNLSHASAQGVLL